MGQTVFQAAFITRCGAATAYCPMIHGKTTPHTRLSANAKAA
nr:hypothetical protein [uncultured Kingella sp.]